MSKWYIPRMGYRVVGDKTSPAYIVEFNGYPEDKVTVDFSFETAEEAEEFYKENRNTHIVDNEFVYNVD